MSATFFDLDLSSGAVPTLPNPKGSKGEAPSAANAAKKRKLPSEAQSSNPPKRTKTVWTMLSKLTSRPTGRICDCCGKNDKMADLAQPSYTMFWGRYLKDELVLGDGAVVSLKTDGTTCWYCLRTWNAVYFAQIPKLSDYKRMLVAQGPAGEALRDNLPDLVNDFCFRPPLLSVGL